MNAGEGIDEKARARIDSQAVELKDMLSANYLHSAYEPPSFCGEVTELLFDRMPAVGCATLPVLEAWVSFRRESLLYFGNKKVDHDISHEGLRSRDCIFQHSVVRG